MAELMVILVVAILVAGIVMLLRREAHPPVLDDRPHPGVQNHEGDE